MRAERNINLPLNSHLFVQGTYGRFGNPAAGNLWDTGLTDLFGLGTTSASTGLTDPGTGMTSAAPASSSTGGSLIDPTILNSLDTAVASLIRAGTTVAVSALTPTQQNTLMTLYTQGHLPGYTLNASGQLVPTTTNQASMMPIILIGGGLLLLLMVMKK